MRYPPSPPGDVTDVYHGHRVADPYRWLEDTDSAQTRAWIDAQNSLTQAWLSRVPGREAIRRRLEQLWDRPRVGAPWRRGHRWFQLRNPGLAEQDSLWTMDHPTATGRVLVDPDALRGSGSGIVALTGIAVSPDGALVAYATSEAGSDWLTWRVRDVATGRDLPDVLHWSKFSPAAWSPHGDGFYYARYDEPIDGHTSAERNLNQRLCYHRLGQSQDADAVVLTRPDQPEWGFVPEVTEDGRWLVVSIWHGTDPRNRVSVADLAGDGELVPLLDEFDASYDLIGSVGDTLYFSTDQQAPHGRVIAVEAVGPARGRQREIVPEQDDAVEQAHLIGGCLVVVTLHHATSRIAIHDLAGRWLRSVPLVDMGSVQEVTGRQDDASLFFSFQSFTRPTQIHRFDLATSPGSPVAATCTELVAGPVPDRPGEYDTTQVFYRSADGTRVPMFLVHRADVRAGAGSHPTLLYGYGGFRIPVTPVYRVPWLVWLERGGVLAVAGLRGGGEYGQPWHEAGRGANKQNVFDDATAAAQWLIDNGWTTAARLGITGASNGGLLAAACLTQRPDLFGAAVIEVGVLDMLRFHRFTIGWAWTSDYGSAEDPEQFATLLSYSPLHNIQPGTPYPPTLLTTGDHDDRVLPGHSFKFAAALQAALQAAMDGDATAGPALIRIETEAGHGAGKPISKQVSERADVLAFLLHTLSGQRVELEA